MASDDPKKGIDKNEEEVEQSSLIWADKFTQMTVIIILMVIIIPLIIINVSISVLFAVSRSKAFERQEESFVRLVKEVDNSDLYMI